MLTDKKVNRFLLPILAVVISYSIYKQINTDKNEKELLSENNYVIGEIIDHRISGLSENFYVEYKYFVDGLKYKKTEFYRHKFRDCHETRKCIGLKYVVYYDENNPENAFMNFNLSEQGIKEQELSIKKMNNQLEKLKIE